MTSICPSSGPSASKPGFNETVIIGAAATEAILVVLGLELVAAILAPIIAPTVYNLTTFCATDPPADPVLTGSDIIAASNWTDPASALAAQSKIRQWFDSNYWYQVCECTGATTPSPPTLSDPGPVSTNPGLPTGATGSLCWDTTQSVSVPASVVNYLAPQFIPNGSFILKNNTPVTGMTNTHAYAIPSGANNLFSILTISQIDPTQPATIDVQFYTSAGSPISAWHIWDSALTTSNFRQTFAIPGTAAYWFVWAANGSSTMSFDFTMEFGFSCAGQSPDSPNSPCCPPDPLLENKLEQILGMVTSIFQSLPAPLSSYAEGTAHAGLSGHGTVTLSSSQCLAVRIDVTTLPSRLGELTGTPVVIFDAGFVSPVTPEGPLAGQRLTYSTQVFLMPPLAAQLDYSLAGGMVVTVTELTAGP
jgi:hypothetical protein